MLVISPASPAGDLPAIRYMRWISVVRAPKEEGGALRSQIDNCSRPHSLRRGNSGRKVRHAIGLSGTPRACQAPCRITPCSVVWYAHTRAILVVVKFEPLEGAIVESARNEHA